MATERLRRRIEQLLDEAEEAISQHNWETVLGHAQSVLALDPENEDGLALIAAAERAGSSSLSVPVTEAVSPPSSTPTEQPASFANGRYEAKRFLGEGGKKKVYLAHDSLLDREVAFALIKTEGLDDVSRMRITREAQAMGRLGSHPHIVTVFDLGEHEGQPYMVTELMGGGDVEGVVEDAPRPSLAPRAGDFHRRGDVPGLGVCPFPRHRAPGPEAG
ncbi:MAG: protein kinase [Dehalococcoidia bacterium]